MGPAIRLALIGLVLGTSLAPAQPARANSWRLGAFPVASFAGYTSAFGMRVHPLRGDVRPHYGLDIAAPLGSPIRSWWSGVVQEVINDGGCGVGLVIRSGGYEHIYCHLGGIGQGGLYRSGDVQLRVGQAVRTGQVIAHVGLSGSTTGPHLHWGLRHGGRWIDPAKVLRAMARARRAPKAAPRPRVAGVR
ncbi:M23 family metallopeptidase [Cyanobium sp. NIES-981]|uniref:M23 family metallopeptidase n=1 Tax=Cyanobium sp. NIES-981 TaxID=1851505 RepID=UPI0007DE0CCF|nr:M23 family metallopeptidase [Cyanobium sp. NIES-981]SBO42544.1 Peptidase M23B [Cyanobium sp. NIES-981]